MEGSNGDQLNRVTFIFKEFDKNDGKIGKKELQVLLEKLSVSLKCEKLAERIDEIDKDGNGIIDFSEFCTYVYNNLMSHNPQKNEQIKTEFKTFDKDGNGDVSMAELKEALVSRGVPLSDEDASIIVHTVDRDGDGRVDYNEFATLWCIMDLAM